MLLQHPWSSDRGLRGRAIPRSVFCASVGVRPGRAHVNHPGWIRPRPIRAVLVPLARVPQRCCTFGVLVGGGPGAFLKLWRWRPCLIVSRVAAPAGLWWSAACAGGPPRHGCATRPRPETGELALVAHRTSRIACAMGWACPRSLAGGRDSRRRFRLVWPSLFEEDLFVWPFRLPLDTNVLTYSGAIVLAITLKPYTA